MPEGLSYYVNVRRFFVATYIVLVSSKMENIYSLDMQLAPEECHIWTRGIEFWFRVLQQNNASIDYRPCVYMYLNKQGSS
jgi:hypothetical protein